MVGRLIFVRLLSGSSEFVGNYVENRSLGKCSFPSRCCGYWCKLEHRDSCGSNEFFCTTFVGSWSWSILFHTWFFKFSKFLYTRDNEISDPAIRISLLKETKITVYTIFDFRSRGNSEYFRNLFPVITVWWDSDQNGGKSRTELLRIS